ncbi:PDZ domain-containing protein [Peribacillus kribbensis]|uniref:PDZ domain-containing protein n=1 Tax=Peribacillus kribbensis TaxID=356658 RepID=UPI0004153A58|nr:PDZ domain-containing protein [Peribacillus kribbensis]
MLESWLFGFLKGAGMVLLHPLFYISFVMCLVIGVLRIKREREDFHTRVEDLYLELKFLLPAGLLLGLIGSILSILAGIVIPEAAIILIAILSLIGTGSLRLRSLSPAYMIGIPFFILMLLHGKSFNLPFFKTAFNSIDHSIYPAVALLCGLLIVIEGILIARSGYKKTSPKLIPSKRGSIVGAHLANRIWLVPLFLLIPGGKLSSPFEWWPVFHMGGIEFTPILVPFLIGFTQQIQGMLPKDSIRMNGRRVIGLGVIIILAAIAGYWYPYAAVIAAAAAVLGRESLHLYQKHQERKLPFYFSRREQGLMVLGIIPGSPAAKMGLSAGEVITKVNGVKARNESEFYEALQRNAAHCKLDVLDNNSEIRYVQRVLYEGEHHELGILFVQEYKRKREAV